MPLPHEEDVAREIVQAHATTLGEMRELLLSAVALVSDGSLTIGNTRGLDRHVVAMVLGLYSKACKTHRSIQHLLAAGLTSDADALLRVLFETTTAIYFILHKQSALRSRMYGMFSSAQIRKAANDWKDTKGLRRSGKSLARDVRLQLNETVAGFAKRLAGIRSNHPYGAAIPLAARAYRRARTAADRQRTLDELAKAVADALYSHWSGKSIHYAARISGLGVAYQTIFRVSSGSTHAADVVSHLGVPDAGDDGYVVLLVPDGENTPRLGHTANLLLWFCMRRINQRLQIGRDTAIESAEPPTIRRRRLAAQRKKPKP